MKAILVLFLVQNPPAAFDLPMPDTTGYTLRTVRAGDSLQQALDEAQPGTIIEIEAGATFIGNFVLPAKANPNQRWIILRTTGALPAGRVTPDAPMPRLRSDVWGEAVIQTAPSAGFYRLIGLDIGVTGTVTQNYGLVLLGRGDSTQNSMELVPQNLVIEKCYIHGNASGNVRRGIGLNSGRTAILDCVVSNIHEVGADSQAICGWNGPGPYKIVNNYLEGAGENVMWGGADPAIANLVPSDIEFRRNHCKKPMEWRTASWSVKNLFELKNAQRVLVDGNIFENNWANAQSGCAILFTVRNQDNTAPWSVVQDVTFTNNIVRHSSAGIQFLGKDSPYPSQQTKRIRVANNLFDDLNGATYGGASYFIQITECDGVTIDHNTVVHTGNITTAYGQPTTGFVFTNNIIRHNDYGVMGDSASPGNLTFRTFFPGVLFRRNVIVGGNSNWYSDQPDNFFTDTWPLVNFRLPPESPYKNQATDGTDPGCNFGAVETATARTISGRPPVQAPLPLYPSPGLVLNESAVTFECTNVGADEYEFMIRYNRNGSWTEATVLSGGARQSTNLPLDRRYTWMARGRTDGAWTDWSPSVEFELINGNRTPPGAPGNVTVVVNGQDVTVSWTGVRGATSYEVSIEQIRVVKKKLGWFDELFSFITGAKAKTKTVFLPTDGSTTTDTSVTLRVSDSGNFRASVQSRNMLGSTPSGWVGFTR